MISRSVSIPALARALVLALNTSDAFAQERGNRPVTTYESRLRLAWLGGLQRRRQ
jgi:hypothetical protein